MYHSLPYYRSKIKERRTKLHKWEKTYPKNSPLFCSEKPAVFICKGATREASCGYVSKLDTWPHQKATKTRLLPFFHSTSGVVRVAPRWAASCCTSLLIPLVGLSKVAPRFDRSSFQKSIAIFVGFKYHQMNGILGFFYISCYRPKNIQEMCF